MGYNTIAQEKIKGEEHFNGLAAHNGRTIFAENIDKSRSHKNIVLRPMPYKNYNHFVEAKREAIRKKNAENGTKNRMLRKRKNKKTGETELPAMAQEFVFSHSHGIMDEYDSIRYLQLAHDFLSEWFQGLEILSSVVHLDEKTPHLHFSVTYFDTERGKFCQKELQQQGKTDIDAIRKAWQERLKDTDFSELKMQDGSVVAGREHERKANKRVDALVGEIEELKEEVSELEIAHKSTQVENEGLKSDLGRAEVALTQKDAQIANLRQEIDNLLSELQEFREKRDNPISKNDLLQKAKDARIAQLQGIIGDETVNWKERNKAIKELSDLKKSNSGENLFYFRPPAPAPSL